MTFFEVLFYCIVFGCLLFFAVLATRFIGGSAKKAMKGQYISIVETVSLGLDKKLHLVKVADQFVLIATCGKSIEYLTRVKISEFEENEAGTLQNVFDFKSFFDKYVNTFKNMKGGARSPNPYESEDLSGGDTFKRNLGRLKTITSKAGKKASIDGDENTNEK